MISELPKGWQRHKFADIIEFLTDFQANGSFAGLKENVQYYSEKNYAVLVRLKDLRHEMKDENSFVYTDERGYNFLKKSRVVEGDILVANVGAGVGTTLQMTKFNGRATLGPNMFRVDLKDSVYKKYFLAFSNSTKYWHQLKLVSAGSGQPKINKTLYKSIEIPLPPKPTQLAIVSKIEELFSELDKGIEQLKTAQQQLKTYRQAVLKWAFEGRLTNENVKERELPEGWKWKTIKEITSVLGDGLHGTPNYTANGDYYFINGNNLSDGKIIFKDSTKRVNYDEYQKHKKSLDKTTILVSINGTLGNTAFYNDEKVILGKSACYFNLNPEANKHYIRYIITSQRFLNYAEETATGSTIPNVSLKAMREFKVPLAPIEEQTRIVQEIESRLSVADKMEESISQSLQQAEALRQSILKKAFEGRLISN